jgi:hypothetical protein
MDNGIAIHHKNNDHPNPSTVTEQSFTVYFYLSDVNKAEERRIARLL